MLAIYSGEPAAAPLRADFERYLSRKKLAPRSQAEYRTTLAKMLSWAASSAKLHRSRTPMQFQSPQAADVEAFLQWVYEQAVAEGTGNPGRVANKCREHLQAWLRWRVDQRELDALPRFPPRLEQIDAAGNFFLEDDEIDQVYWATYHLPKPRNWKSRLPIGAYWRTALVLFYNLGVDTHTLFPQRGGEAVRRGDIFLQARSPSRTIRIAEQVQPLIHGWLYFARKKTGKEFERPLNQAMYEHVKLLLADDDRPDSPLLSCRGVSAGGCRPNERFGWLIKRARIEARIDLRTRTRHDWNLKHLRKTAGSAHEVAALSPMRSGLGGADVLGHSDAKVTHGNYVNAATAVANRIPLLPQPRSFTSIYDDSVRPPDLLFAK